MAHPEKRVGERRLYTVSYEQQPEMTTENIASVNSIIAEPNDVVLEIPSPAFDAKHSQVWISAGQPQKYRIIHTVTTDQGSRLVGDMPLRVIAD
jgi:hypothetical protein